MKADEPTALKGELLPIIEALTTNETLTSLDISGHQGGDSLATAIGRSGLCFLILSYLFFSLFSIKRDTESSIIKRLLQINSTLRSLEIDDNAITLVGFQRLRDGLNRNTTLQQMTMPVYDAMSVKKKNRASTTLAGTQRNSSLQALNDLSTIIKEMENKLSQNYSRPKASLVKNSHPSDENIRFKYIVSKFYFQIL